MIRNANKSNAAHIRTLMQSVPGFWQPQWSEQTISDAIESANGLACAWEKGSEVLGFVCAHDLGFRAHLSELVVATRARQKGMLQAIEERLTQRGRTVIIADVWREAEPFYRSRGWEPPDVVLLARRLSAAAQ